MSKLNFADNSGVWSSLELHFGRKGVLENVGEEIIENILEVSIVKVNCIKNM